MGQLITVRDVERRAADTSAIVFDCSDVVTPAALDRARELGLDIEWIDSRPRTEAPALLMEDLRERIERVVTTVAGEAAAGDPDRVVEAVLRRLGGDVPAIPDPRTVSQRLAVFAVNAMDTGVAPEVAHEAKRLLLNNLKASVGAMDHAAVTAVRGFVAGLGTAKRPARVLWHGDVYASELAALVNSVQMEVLDFNETHVPTYVHTAAAVAPAVMAEAEARGRSGHDLLAALAIGIEVELAVSEMLMPSHYVRGFNPTATTGAVGAAAGCAVLGGRDIAQVANALGIAMNTAGGLFEAIGSMGWPYSAANAARTGVMAARLAGSGLVTAPTTFEGEKGMFVAYSDEDPAKLPALLDGLGDDWRMMQAGYKRFQAETIDQAPLEAVLTIRSRSAEPHGDVTRMRFSVEPVVAAVADERYRRFGSPRDDLQATFDLRYVMAAAWVLGRTGGDVYDEVHFRDPVILALRDRIDVVADPAITLDGASLEIEFADGTRDDVRIEAWKGSAANPMSDTELSELFLEASSGRIPRHRAEDVVNAVFSADTFSSVDRLTRRIVR